MLHYLFIDSSSLYLLYFSAKERFYVFNDSKPRRQKTFCQRHFVLCGMASAYPFYHSCTFIQHRMDPACRVAAAVPVSFCHRSSVSGVRWDACLCRHSAGRSDPCVFLSPGRAVLLCFICCFYGDTDNRADSPQDSKSPFSRAFVSSGICLCGGAPHFGAMDHKNSSGHRLTAALLLPGAGVCPIINTMKCPRGRTAASTASLHFRCSDQYY